MTVQNIIEKLDKHSPIEAALDWDNVGLLVGDPTASVNSIYIALDVTDEVVTHAIDNKVDLLLTHHPLIFSGIKKITADNFIGRRVINLIQNNISYVAFHTNFDVFGMGDEVASKLNLTDCTPLDVTFEDEGIGRIGSIAVPVTLKTLAEEVKSTFNIEAVNIYGNLEQKVQRIAVCPGSGKSEVDAAVNGDADVLITGDISHHTGIDSLAQGLTIIDAGHYGLEHIFIDYMSDYLSDTNLTIYTEPICNPYTTL